MIGGKLVVARRQPTSLLNLVEEALHPVAVTIEVRAEADQIVAIAFGEMLAHAPFFMASSLIQLAS